MVCLTVKLKYFYYLGFTKVLSWPDARAHQEESDWAVVRMVQGHELRDQSGWGLLNAQEAGHCQGRSRYLFNKDPLTCITDNYLKLQLSTVVILLGDLNGDRVMLTSS